MQLTKWILYAVLAMQVFYIPYMIYDPSIPGWKMFADVKFEKFEIQNAEGATVSVREQTISPTYGFSKNQAFGISAFLCRRDQKDYTLIFSEEEKYAVATPTCRPQKL